MNDRAGASFEDADVVENYRFRPPYPERFFQRLVEIAPAKNSLLDIGCGPGKISRALTHQFAHVTAVDPSKYMIALGRSLPNGSAPNIEWIEGLAENFPIGERTFDLTVAAASIHWMDRSRLFPRLAEHANPGHLFAIATGDDAFEPVWEDDWLRFLVKWIPEVTARPFDQARIEQEWESFGGHVDVLGNEHFTSDAFEQSISDFIRCQHSRDTFAPSNLGSRITAFDEELRQILAPHSHDGLLSYRVRTKLIWGEIRKG